MFAKVFLEMESRPDALVIPKAALALDSLGNTVYVAGVEGGAERRDLELGFRSDDLLEVLSGVEEREPVVVVGQDGLSDGTPVEVLGTRPLPSRGDGAGKDVGDSSEDRSAEGASGSGTPASEARRERLRRAASEGDGSGRPRGETGPGRGGPGDRGGPFADLDLDDPEQVERVKGFLRQRGLSEGEIEERLERMRERRRSGGGPGGGGPGGGAGGR